MRPTIGTAYQVGRRGTICGSGTSRSGRSSRRLLGTAKGNENRRGTIRIRKNDLNVLDYAWAAAHYEHWVRYRKTAFNPRWLGFLLTVASAHDLDVAKELERRVRAMRMSVQYD